MQGRPEALGVGRDSLRRPAANVVAGSESAFVVAVQMRSAIVLRTHSDAKVRAGR